MSVQRYFPEGLPKAIGPYSPLTSCQGFETQKQRDPGNKLNEEVRIFYVSGQIPINPETNSINCKEIEGQTHQVMRNLGQALSCAGCSFSSVLKTTILLTVTIWVIKDMSFFIKVNQIYGSYFNKGQYPARVCYAVKALPLQSLIEIDALAIQQKWIEGEKPVKRVKLTKQENNDQKEQ